MKIVGGKLREESNRNYNLLGIWESMIKWGFFELVQFLHLYTTIITLTHGFIMYFLIINNDVSRSI